MPAGFGASKKPLQAYIDPAEHWAFKQQTVARAIDMSRVVDSMVQVFNTDPDLWLRLMERADDDRTTLGELIAPALRAAEATA